MHSNDAQMLVLTVLADGPLHGYAINASIEESYGPEAWPREPLRRSCPTGGARTDPANG